MMNPQFLYAAREGLLNIHDLGSTPFLCVYDTFFLLSVRAVHSSFPSNILLLHYVV